MKASPEQQFDQLVDAVQSGRLNRREFFRRCALLGVSLTTVMQVLDATKGGAATAAELPQNWDPYPFKWGMDPIADNVNDAIKWYLDRFKDSAVPDSDPSVVLTEDEIKQLQAMKPRVGHSWYDLAVPAIAGWNDFWKQGVSKWTNDIAVYDCQAKPERLLLGTQFLVDQGLHVAGTLVFDWILFTDSMKRFHAAKVATTSVATAPSAYYPPTCMCMGDDVFNARALVMPVAQFLHSKGYKEVDAVWLVEAHPSLWAIARQTGFKQGLDDPKVQELCKINVVETKQVLENEETEAAASAALQQHPDLHLFIMLAHQEVGASAAVRSAGRHDVWVVAYDLDESTAGSLLHGGWPVMITFSLPISGSGLADANVMGKILLGKKVPFIVLSQGTVTTTENVKEAYAKDWGGRPIPWK
jgi:ribose transport system substrate-binding protein